MEQLFAVRVLVHYFDKPKVDHSAVRRLLAAACVDSLQLFLTDGTSISLFSYIEITQPERKSIADVLGSGGTSLIQVASVLMLAEARASADALCTSAGDLETACDALERLLGCLATTKPSLPLGGIAQSARVRLGSAARRRALSRLTRDSPRAEVQSSILQAVNAVLRLCDVATHCLAVVSRQNIAPQSTCEVAVTLSTRLLTLAASLFEVHRVELKPALSFSSSNSLRTALVAGAMHLGAITIEHLDIEPMNWVHVANRIVSTNATSVPSRTSVMSALFGGMIKSGKAYLPDAKGCKAAHRACFLLSTLHVVLETDSSRDTMQQPVMEPTRKASKSATQHSGSKIVDMDTISQAARSFLGERVVAAEEDGDEGRIAARTVYQACEEYVARAGEADGMFGLLSRFFATAARQCRHEASDDPVVSLSDSAQTPMCPPDESDASSDCPLGRSDSHPFPMDVFDQRSREGILSSPRAGVPLEEGTIQSEGLDLHRQIGALTLEALGHWMSRTHLERQYQQFDVADFVAGICHSASLFSFSESSASYDLRSAMCDFGSLAGPAIEQNFTVPSSSENMDRWTRLVRKLVGAGQKANPVLLSVISHCGTLDSLEPLLDIFVERGSPIPRAEHGLDTPPGLSVGSIARILLSLVGADNSLEVVRSLTVHLSNCDWNSLKNDTFLWHTAASLMLLSHVVALHLGTDEMQQFVRKALASLFYLDGDGKPTPIFPAHQEGCEAAATSPPRMSVKAPKDIGKLVSYLRSVPEIMEVICEKADVLKSLRFAACSRKPSLSFTDGGSPQRERGCYHLLWAISMMRSSLEALDGVSRSTLSSNSGAKEPILQKKMQSLFQSHRISESPSCVTHIEKLETTTEESLTLLYIAECCARTRFQNQAHMERPDTPRLATTLARLAIAVLSAGGFLDSSSRYEAIGKVFQASLPPRKAPSLPSAGGVVTSRPFDSTSTSLELAMSYIHEVGTDCIPLLASRALMSASQLLDRWNHPLPVIDTELALKIASSALLLAESNHDLRDRMRAFAEKYISLCFMELKNSPETLNDVIALTMQVTGFVQLIASDSQSEAGIHSLCKLARETASDAGFDDTALTISLGFGKVPVRFGERVCKWLEGCLPSVTLQQLLSCLLIPKDESAVGVSAHAQSLQFLTRACESCEGWRRGTLFALHDLFSSGNDEFAHRLVWRSIMQSATMNDSVITIFEKVVGPSNSPHGRDILLKSFKAAREILEGLSCNATLDCRIRLVTFAVRMSLSFGKLVEHGCASTTELLEPALYEILFGLLRKSAYSLIVVGRSDILGQFVIFLCGLLDAIHSGLYDSYHSVFASALQDSISRNKGPPIVLENCQDGQKVISPPKEGSTASSDGADTQGSKAVTRLCTYTSTGHQYVEQHWYFCYTCDLAGSDGVCSVCARVCHEGCELAYSKFSRFFCDCGAGSDPRQDSTCAGDCNAPGERCDHGVAQAAGSVVKRRKTCQRLRPPICEEQKCAPEQQVPSSHQTTISSLQQERDFIAWSALRSWLSSSFHSLRTKSANARSRTRYRMVEAAFTAQLQQEDSVSCLVEVALFLLRDLDGSHPTSGWDSEWRPTFLGKELLPTQSMSLTVSEGSVSSQCARLTKMQRGGGDGISCTVVQAQRGSLLSQSPYVSVAAVGGKSGLVEIIDASEFILRDTALDKPMPSVVSRANVSFAVSHISFHPENSNLLLVVGKEKVAVMFRVQRSNGIVSWVSDSVEVGLTEFDGSEGQNRFIEAMWVTGEAASVLVVTEKFVKVFDVAADTFCPSFYTTIPERPGESNAQAISDPSTNESSCVQSPRSIVAAEVVQGVSEPRGTSSFVILMISDGTIHATPFMLNQAVSPTFSLCYDLSSTEEATHLSKVNAMAYQKNSALLCVSFTNGNCLFICFGIRYNLERVEISTQWASIFKDAIPSGNDINLQPVAGERGKFVYFQRGQPATSCGVMSVNTDRTLSLNQCAGNSASAVAGVTPLVSQSSSGELVANSVLVLWDDGSISRLEYGQSRPSQIPTPQSWSSIVERKRKRSLRSISPRSDSDAGYRSVPDPIGFFEKSRLVSDQLIIEGIETSRAPSEGYERMGVTLAGESGDSVVSPQQNVPFSFSALIENPSLVLVGARLRFGGTERSRNRVPQEVRIFGRPVPWKPKNGAKRWLDIPFTVPESMESPQKVRFELIPRRPNADGCGEADGLVAVDCLELHAVSTVEFTERKLLFEREKAKRLGNVKDQKVTSRQVVNLDCISSARNGDSAVPEGLGGQLNEQQAAVVAVLHSIQSSRLNVGLFGSLFHEVNCLWSSSPSRSFSRDANFRRYLTQLCFNRWLVSSDNRGPSEPIKSIEFALTSMDVCISHGILPDLLCLEKCLFSLSGLARALLSVGAQKGLSAEAWSLEVASIMNSRGPIMRMLHSYLSLGKLFRQYLRSPEEACVNATDVSLVRGIVNVQSPPESKWVLEAYGPLVKLMCCLDQHTRLLACQRIVELFDTVDSSDNLVRSPFERFVASQLLRRSEVSDKSDSKNLVTPDGADDDCDGSQRWAYRCDSCSEVCDREWWHCSECDDFDLCSDCLRSPNSSADSTHDGSHMLLRGTIEEEVSEHENPESLDLSPVCHVVQQSIGPIFEAILSEMWYTATPNDSWRYIDAFDSIAQLVGPNSAEYLRSLRLLSLFNTSFPAMFSKAVKAMLSATATLNDLTQNPYQRPNSCNTDVLLLMLRLLGSSRGSVMPLLIHKHGFVKCLWLLLSAMHGKLRLFSEALTHAAIIGPTETNPGPLSESVWNEAIPGYTPELFTESDDSGAQKPMNRLFGVEEGLTQASTVFFTVLVEVLRVLEYSFQSVWSNSIAEQMEQMPRSFLCDIIHFAETAGSSRSGLKLLWRLRSVATGLLSVLSLGNTQMMNSILYKYLYREQSDRLKAVLSSTKEERHPRSYKETVKVGTILRSLHRAASKYTDTWRAYLIENEEVLLTLFEAIRSCDGQLQVYALQLFAAALAVSVQVSSLVIGGQAITPIDGMTTANKGRDVTGDSTSRGGLSFAGRSSKEVFNHLELMDACRNQAQVDGLVLLQNDSDCLRFLVEQVLLKSQNVFARRAASQVLMFAMTRAASGGDSQLVKTVFNSVIGGLDRMQYAGDVADGLMVFLRYFVVSCQDHLLGVVGDSLLTKLSQVISDLLKDRCSALVAHPNARIYGRLSEFLDLNGYYLESTPCLSCASSTWESSEKRACRLDTIRVETKFTDSAIMHRLVSTYEIFSVSVKVIDPRRQRLAKRIEVFYSDRNIADAAELKSPNHPWKELNPLLLGTNSTEASVDLIVPVPVCNIKLAFTEFHTFVDVTSSDPNHDSQVSGSSASGANNGRRSLRLGDSLQCPRCSRAVTDRHGICRNCHENAYQCRQCRNINYENLDGFLCNECGYCKHGRFEFSVNGKPTHATEVIQNEEDRKRAFIAVERETNDVHRCIDQLNRLRTSIIKSLKNGVPVEDSVVRSKPFSNTRAVLADFLESVAPRSDMAVLEALLEGQVSQEIEDSAHPSQPVSITEEGVDAAGENDAHDRDHSHRSASNLASPVNRPGRTDATSKAHGTDLAVNRNASSLALIYGKECRTIFASMCRGVRVLTSTSAELVRYANRIGGERLQHAKEFLSDVTRDPIPNHVPPDAPTCLQDEQYRRARRFDCCFACTQAFISNCVSLMQAIVKRDGPGAALSRSSEIVRYLISVSSLCEKSAIRNEIRELVTYLVHDNSRGTQLVCQELGNKIAFCLESYETIDTSSIARFDMGVLESICLLDDNCWEERLRLVMRVLFKSADQALSCSSVAESVILPCLRIALKLLRSDSELTVVETASSLDGGQNIAELVGMGSVGKENLDTSETDNEEPENSVHTAPPMQAEGRPTEAPRLRLPENSAGLGYPQVEAAPGSGAAAPGGLVARELSRIEERRVTQRVGSDLMSGSRAPSSIGTAFDGHISDEDMEVLGDKTDQFVNAGLIPQLQERDHDEKWVSANVFQWLDGKQSQSSWINDLLDRHTDSDDREKLLQNPELQQVLHLAAIFHRWKRLVQHSSGAGRQESEPEPKVNILFIDKGNWLIRLILFTPCADARKEASTLLELICGNEDILQLYVLDALCGPSLSIASEVGEKSKEFFDLLESTLQSKSHKLYLIGKGFISRLADLIRTRAELLMHAEVESEASVRVANFMEGYSLKRLVSVLRLVLEELPTKKLFLRQRILEREECNVVLALQKAYLCLRKLICLKTRLTDESSSQLCAILLSRESLFVGQTVTTIVSSCVSELRAANDRNDSQAVAILLEELCMMLCPERTEPTCFLTLNKAPTQEEFIRGSMSRNPYSSASFDGPLMRDVKNKICKDLDLPGLLEDDFAMELLVAGYVVKLDLTIMQVYENVWKRSAAATMAAAAPPSQLSRSLGIRRGVTNAASRLNRGPVRPEGLRGSFFNFRRTALDRDVVDEVRSESRQDPPMIVVYRLSGLDGEATEPIVATLAPSQKDEQSAEELYKDTNILGQVGGFDVLFQLLAVVGSWEDDAETAVRAPALRLLRASCEVSNNRSLLAKSPNAVSTILDCAASAFAHAQGSPAAVGSAESLLIAAEQILAEQRSQLDLDVWEHQPADRVTSQEAEIIMSRLKVFLRRLDVATSSNAENSILRLLPFLIQGVANAINVVVEHLSFSWERFDDSEEEQRKAKRLGVVLLATPRDLRGNSFAARAVSAGIAERGVIYILDRFPMPHRENRVIWEQALEGSGVALVLNVLAGLSSFFGSSEGETQRLMREIFEKYDGFVSVLCQLELAVSENAVGTSAEELLEVLAMDAELHTEVGRNRDLIRVARREAAEASRAAIMHQTGLASTLQQLDGYDARTTSGQLSNAGNPSWMSMLDEVPDETGPSCVVCGDGFCSRPEEALALYVFCKKTPLDLSSTIPVKHTGSSQGDGSASGNQSEVRLDWELWPTGRGRHETNTTRSSSSSCYSSVTHMNAIHLSCHKEASRVDRSSRRDEWEGAALRNSQTKCNNLLPVRPPLSAIFFGMDHGGSSADRDHIAAVCPRYLTEREGYLDMVNSATASYATAVQSYFNRLSSLGRTSLSQTKTVLYDIGRCLLKFSHGSSGVFSEHSRGGGAHSNACLIPHMIALAIFVMEGASSEEEQSQEYRTNIQTQRNALHKYLFEDEGGDITYYLATGLILLDKEEMGKNVEKYLRRTLSEKGLMHGQALRLVAFSDLINRVLKKDVVVRAGEPWLPALRKHIGGSEVFAENFGDVVNARWERYVRGVETDEDFMKALESNWEEGNIASDSDVTMEIRETLSSLRKEMLTSR